MSAQRESWGLAWIGRWIGRVIAVLVLIPIRLLWEGVTLMGRGIVAALVFFLEHLLEPVCTLLWHWVIRPAWHFVANILWGWLLQHVLWGLVLTPVLAVILDYVLRPVRRAIEEWLWRRVLRPVAGWLWRRVLYPVAKAVALVALVLGEWFIVRPLYALWRWGLHPLWRALRTILRFGWKVATLVVAVLVVMPCAFVYRTVLRPIFAAFTVAWRTLVTRPLRWSYRNVITPMNRWAADTINAALGR
ncbi:hypothetical protein [Nocardia sp. NPDC050710]|uniref:hypothetical protein n=1 Tax=Nocardia sp. NPDC050710 TaxID=3157220 RepID=UPI0033F297D1